MQYLCFCVRLTSFIIMSSNFMLLQDIWQNQYNIVKFKNKIKFKKKWVYVPISDAFKTLTAPLGIKTLEVFYSGFNSNNHLALS